MLKPNVPILVETGQSDTVQIRYNSLQTLEKQSFVESEQPSFIWSDGALVWISVVKKTSYML